MRSIYRTSEQDEREKVSIGSYNTVMVAERRSHGRNNRARAERTRCFEFGQLCHGVDCPNRNRTKVGNGSVKKPVKQQYTEGGDVSDKWCSPHKTKTHSDAECLKHGKNTE